jgi:hypothetical protein
MPLRDATPQGRGRNLMRGFDVRDSTTTLNADLFRKYVSVSPECWEWTGATDRWGYGKFHLKAPSRRMILAHRASWIIHFGEIPPGMCVLHRCDNPRCVNPEHLFLGSVADNNRDMVSKGRQAKGCTLSNLTDSDVLAIRSRYANGETQASLAAEFGVASSRISQMCTGKTWKHLAPQGGGTE